MVHYDHMKESMDIIDLLSCMNTTRMKTRRYSLNVNFFFCDTVRTNALTLFKSIDKNC